MRPSCDNLKPSARRLALHGDGEEFFINGRAFDNRQIDLVSWTNQVEFWETVNHGGMVHDFHLSI
jgi:FtsP/CotA-like multicopper oxidase with cupredoxin domain